jgi:hypothetical protein
MFCRRRHDIVGTSSRTARTQSQATLSSTRLAASRDVSVRYRARERSIQRSFDGVTKAGTGIATDLARGRCPTASLPSRTSSQEDKLPDSGSCLVHLGIGLEARRPEDGTNRPVTRGSGKLMLNGARNPPSLCSAVTVLDLFSSPRSIFVWDLQFLTLLTMITITTTARSITSTSTS